jgi:hypothetical protein
MSFSQPPSGTVILLILFLQSPFPLCPFTSDLPFPVCSCHSVFISGYTCLLSDRKKLLHLFFQNKNNKLTVILKLRPEQQWSHFKNFFFFFFQLYFFFFFLHRAWLELVLFFLTLNIYMKIYIKMFSKYFLLLAGLFLVDHGHSSHLIPLRIKMCFPCYHP